MVCIIHIHTLTHAFVHFDIIFNCSVHGYGSIKIKLKHVFKSLFRSCKYQIKMCVVCV